MRLCKTTRSQNLFPLLLTFVNIFNLYVRQIDPRTLHEAKPVIKGKKFAANSWIHLFDYTVPNLWGCTGVFD